MILVSSKFSIQNDIFMLFFLAGRSRSHAVAGLWLWIAVVDVVCHVWAWADDLWGSDWYGTKLSTPHLVLLSGTIDSQADGVVRLDSTAIHFFLPITVIFMVVVQLSIHLNANS